eukprot:COSAG01_NODE_18954_length_1041_cov_1.060510_1_plen_297_part_10
MPRSFQRPPKRFYSAPPVPLGAGCVTTCELCIVKCRECGCDELSTGPCRKCCENDFTAAGKIDLGQAVVPASDPVELRHQRGRARVFRCSNCKTVQAKQKKARVDSGHQQGGIRTSRVARNPRYEHGVARRNEVAIRAGLTVTPAREEVPRPTGPSVRAPASIWSGRVLDNRSCLRFTRNCKAFTRLRAAACQPGANAAAKAAYEDFMQRFCKQGMLRTAFPRSVRREACRNLLAYVAQLPPEERTYEWICDGRRGTDGRGLRARQREHKRLRDEAAARKAAAAERRQANMERQLSY